MAEYIADKLGDVPTLSASIAHTILTQSPLHAWFAHPRLIHAPVADDSEIADIGSIAHHILLAGDTRDIVTIDAKDYRTNAAKEARDYARAGGRIPVLQHKLAAINDMVLAARAYLGDSEIAGVMDEGEPESTIVWHEGDTWCRCRPDWLSSIHLSVKTTAGSAEPDTWIRNHLSLDGHDMAAVFYERGIAAVLQGKHRQTVFLLIEQAPPHGCSLVGLSPAQHDLASRKLDRAIALWASSMATGKWPSYSGRIAYAEPAAWQMAQQDERELHDFELGGQA